MSESSFMLAVRDLFTTADGIDADKYVLVTFQIVPGPGLDLRAAAAKMALVASIGTVAPLETEDARTRMELGPRVVHPAVPPQREDSGQSSQITLALPVSLMGERDPLVYLMSISMFAAEYNYVSAVRLELIDIPKSVLTRFDGPRFGISGVRKLWGITDRPVLGAILKPRIGVSLQSLADSAQAALEGGADIVFDDELVVDPAGPTKFDRRVPALVDAAARAAQATGQPKAAVVNITGRPSHAVEYGHRAVECGAKGVLFNGFVGGFPAMQEVVEADFGVPLLACNVGSGFLSRDSNGSGISGAVLAKLSRLAGADGFQTGILAGDAHTVEAWGPSVLALDRPLGHIRPSLPIVAGGLNVGNLWGNWLSLGNNVIFAAGSGIFGSPGGPRKGAEALALMLEMLEPGMSPDEARETVLKLAGKNRNFKATLDAYGYKPPN